MQFFTTFTQLEGPVFLLLYAVMFAAFICACMVLRHQIDKDDTGRPIEAGVDPDPYQMAYLRGGINEVCRLATFELFEKRALDEKNSWNGSVRWTLKPSVVNAANCSPFALAASAFYTEPRRPTEIFRSDVASRFTSQFRDWDDWIEREELRIAPDKQFKMNGLALVLAAVYAAVGLLKIVAAVLHDRYNIGFAIAMLIAGTIVILITRSPRRFNARGRRFLSATQIINGKHRRIAAQSVPSSIQSDVPMSSGLATSGMTSMPMMAMGLFGVAALQGSSYDDFRKTYQKSESTGGGCGASCAGASWSSGCGSSHLDGTTSAPSGGNDVGSSCGASSWASCGASGGASCGGGGGCGGGCGGGGCGGS